MKVYKDSPEGLREGTGVIFHKEGLVDRQYERYEGFVRHERYHMKAYLITDYELVAGPGNIHIRRYDSKHEGVELPSARYWTRGWKVASDPLNYDPILGLAVLSMDCIIKEPELVRGGRELIYVYRDCEALSFGIDNPAPAIGEEVIAIGYDMGSREHTTVTKTNVAALHHQVEPYEVNLVQTDASLNPGNTGGVLLDGDYRIVGILQARFSEDGVSRAIAAKDIVPLLNSLIKKRRCDGNSSIPKYIADLSIEAIFINPPKPPERPSWEEPVEFTWDYGFMVRETRKKTDTYSSSVMEGVHDYGMMVLVNDDGQWALTIQEMSIDDSRRRRGTTLHTLDSGRFDEDGISFRTGVGEYNHIMFIADGEDTYYFSVNGVRVPLDIDLAYLQEFYIYQRDRSHWTYTIGDWYGTLLSVNGELRSPQNYAEEFKVCEPFKGARNEGF